MRKMVGSSLQVVVVNYESAWRLEDEILKWKPDMIVCDESSKIKNAQAKCSKALHHLGKQSAYNLILTGTDNSMLQLADELAELREQKSELQGKLKELNRQIEAITSALVAEMTEQECVSFSRGKHMFVLAIKEYLSAIPEEKERLYEAMKQNGFEHLFTIPTNTLSATLKELKSNNYDELPTWLEGMVGSYEEASIQVRKSTK